MEGVQLDCEGSIFLVTLSFANRCKTLRDVIEDAGTSGVIPTPNISPVYLKQMVEWHENSQWKMIPDGFTPKEDMSNSSLMMKKKFEPTEWESRFIETLTGTALLELMLAANYLAMKDLIDFLSHVVIYQKVMGVEDRLGSIQDMYGAKREPITEEEYEETANEPDCAFIKVDK